MNNLKQLSFSISKFNKIYISQQFPHNKIYKSSFIFHNFEISYLLHISGEPQGRALLLGSMLHCYMCLQVSSLHGSVSNLIISIRGSSNVTDLQDYLHYYSLYNNIISIIAICKIGCVSLTGNLMETDIFYIFLSLYKVMIIPLQ